MQDLNAGNDGSIDAAVSMMSDVDLDKPLMSFEEAQNLEAGISAPAPRETLAQPTAKDREPNGQFAKKEADPKGIDAAALVAKAAPDVDASTPDEEYFELPPDTEGGEAKRIKATEVWEGYQERELLRQELANAKRVAPPPIEWDQQMYETVKARGQLIDQLRMMEQIVMPQEPDERLIDPNSPNYNPDLYHQQRTGYRQALGRMQQIQSRSQELNTQQTREQEALLRARQLREQSKLHDIWPDIKDPATQRRVRDESARFYGITDQDFAETYDSRLFAILKDALAYRQSLAQRQSAVKVVRSVPKLVKAQGRTAQPKGQAVYSSSMDRLARTGSLEDAANAIGGLL